MLKDKFAHDFVYERNGQILQSAEGELSDIALKVSGVQQVSGLSFDLDIKDLHTQFKSCYVDYLKLAVPELGLIQTSPTGDMHGRLLFEKPVSLENSKKYLTQKKI